MSFTSLFVYFVQEEKFWALDSNSQRCNNSESHARLAPSSVYFAYASVLRACASAPLFAATWSRALFAKILDVRLSRLFHKVLHRGEFFSRKLPRRITMSRSTSFVAKCNENRCASAPWKKFESGITAITIFPSRKRNARKRDREFQTRKCPASRKHGKPWVPTWSRIRRWKFLDQFWGNVVLSNLSQKVCDV